MQNEEIKMLTEIERGRLHIVRKTNKIFRCYDCDGDILKGSACYTQRIKTQEQYFPLQLRICSDCGKKQIEKGVEVKD